MFGKILIANRGEIACRILRTAHRLGIACVAVHGPDDAHARWIEAADEAYAIPSGDYLDAAALIDIAGRAGAQAIHPGYGFLSENADFARACARAGLTFIGAGEKALATMGSKAAAKALLGNSAVPLLPGYHGEEQTDARLTREAVRIGYPVLIKASLGGGGKGMRRVDTPAALGEALAACRREARAAFGDERLLIEKYLLHPRHIEFQIFADGQGQCLHLFERDCSVQRRHQKVLEEAPAPGLSAAMRARMGAAACEVARAVDYLGAGTVEFIVDSRCDAFYFMEMNTRLQVEHPVTEMITGLDLVEWQLRVACGEPLPLQQSALVCRGHAVEARLYAEDPAQGFLPASGRLERFRAPEAEGVRVDSGFRAGDTVSAHFDPMLAKLIAHGATRAEALTRLARALEQFHIAGVANNLAFLRRLVMHPAFSAGMVDTGFIEQYQDALLPPATAPRPEWLALLLLDELLPARPGDSRVWTRATGWRTGLAPAVRVGRWRAEDGVWHEARLSMHHGACHLLLGERRLLLEEVRRQDETLHARIDGRTLHAEIVHAGRLRWLLLPEGVQRFEAEDPLARGTAGTVHEGRLHAPMHGRIVRLCVPVGQPVAQGDALLIMEAMKMEHTLHAPAAGLVRAYHFRAGDPVEEGAELLEFETEGNA